MRMEIKFWLAPLTGLLSFGIQELESQFKFWLDTLEKYQMPSFNLEDIFVERLRLTKLVVFGMLEQVNAWTFSRDILMKFLTLTSTLLEPIWSLLRLTPLFVFITYQHSNVPICWKDMRGRFQRQFLILRERKYCRQVSTKQLGFGIWRAEKRYRYCRVTRMKYFRPNS